MKRFAFLLVCITWLISIASVATAEKAGRDNGDRERVELVIFSEPGCPYCKRAKAFLMGQQGKRNWLNIREYEVSASAAATDLFRRTNELFGIERPGVPLIVIGGRPFLGFDEAESTGAAIMAVATACRQSACPTLAGILGNGGTTSAAPTVGQGRVIPENMMNTRFFGATLIDLTFSCTRYRLTISSFACPALRPSALDRHLTANQPSTRCGDDRRYQPSTGSSRA